MRLQAIKLSGFKSFVDHTTVSFPGNLCAVVGPNGCGKSNIIDAVRWVMGETSAKTLRGESMSDVIFSGSNTRKPVGQASIELIFDNAEGRMTGEYASYSEISVKRQVTRDGASNYFLNNHKCRRKDITDIFLGTGLGPRSYSIIEQGMISQLIEARPEDLRTYIEEAAGISKYKERRKETERRISHTRENLDRLSDLREELERQLHHLERQSKSAIKYREFKEEERALRAQLQTLRWQSIGKELKGLQDQINRLEIELEARIADERRIEAEVESRREKLTEKSDEMNEVQRRYYDHGTEIARIEESIQHQRQRNEQLLNDLNEVRGNLEKVDTDVEQDKRELAQMQAQLESLAPKRERLTELEQQSADNLQQAETRMHEWQQNWDSFNESAAGTNRESEVQQSRIDHLEESIDRLRMTNASLSQRQEALSGSDLEHEIGPMQEMLQVQEQQITRIEQEIKETIVQISAQREENQQLTQSLDTVRSNLQSARGRQASLEALQQAALGRQDDDEVNWLSHQGLGDGRRLGEDLRVEAPWHQAVETVLGDHLQAVCVDAEMLESVSSLINSFEKGALEFVAFSTQARPLSDVGTNATADDSYLISKVTGGRDVSVWLSGVRLAEDLASALALRKTLNRGESVITPEGLWLGPDWIRVSRETDASTGVIRRQEELDQLAESIADSQRKQASLEEQLESGDARLKVLESERDAQQSRLAEQQRVFGETRARLGAAQVQLEQNRADLGKIQQDLESNQDQLDEDEMDLREARNRLQQALDQMEAQTQQRGRLVAERENNQAALAEARTRAAADRDEAHQLALQLQSLNSGIGSLQEAMRRLEGQHKLLRERRDNLEQNLRDSESPGNQLREELDEQLRLRAAVEEQLQGLRREVEGIEHEIREMGRNRGDLEESLENIRAQLEALRLERQTLNVRQSTIQDALREEAVELEEVVNTMPEGATEEEWETRLTQVGNRIARLGAINLAAIDEFKLQSERKEYLDAQNEDLVKALETLESAIRKIDVETRTRFKETFDKVNGKLQQLFPKLFGGGHAYLEMTGDDLLSTGIGLMARPPGKRNTSIHLLSGGEKALTAIALVFSIFSLNPAPFCMLDEVDAPLDDTNVGRYSDMVKEMSRTVQFVYITHNKLAMEMADQLMGVTMHEPGVSRLVSVDVDEAVAMAAV